MLQEPMMEKLTAMRLTGMVDALKAQEQDPMTLAKCRLHAMSPGVICIEPTCLSVLASNATIHGEIWARPDLRSATQTSGR